jgi:hypothetical protein
MQDWSEYFAHDCPEVQEISEGNSGQGPLNPQDELQQSERPRKPFQTCARYSE